MSVSTSHREDANPSAPHALCVGLRGNRIRLWITKKKLRHRAGRRGPSLGGVTGRVERMTQRYVVPRRELRQAQRSWLSAEWHTDEYVGLSTSL